MTLLKQFKSTSVGLLPLDHNAPDADWLDSLAGRGFLQRPRLLLVLFSHSSATSLTLGHDLFPDQPSACENVFEM